MWMLSLHPDLMEAKLSYSCSALLPLSLFVCVCVSCEVMMDSAAISEVHLDGT